MTRTRKKAQFRLKRLTGPELKGFVEVSRMLSEPWALDLLRHAAGPHSSIDVNGLAFVDQPEPLVISRLHAFEDQNLLRSRFERRGKTVRRVFHITQLGRRVVALSR